MSVSEMYKQVEEQIPESNHKWIYTGNSKNNVIAYFFCMDLNCNLMYNLILHKANVLNNNEKNKI